MESGTTVIASGVESSTVNESMRGHCHFSELALDATSSVFLCFFFFFSFSKLLMNNI